MNENILKALVAVSLILSITAVALEARDEFSLIDPSKIEGTALTFSNDGSGSGLDSDMLDGTDSSQFLRNDVSGTIEGDIYVNGNITHQPQYRYLTIPAASFLPVSDTISYSQFGSILYPHAVRPESNIFYAPIQLPDGAKITKIIMQYTKDEASALLKLILDKREYPSAYDQIYTVELPLKEDFESQPFESENLSIDISNYNAAYSMNIIMEIDNPFDVLFNWVTIEYVVTNSLP